MDNNISYVAVGLFLEEKAEKAIIDVSQNLYDNYGSWWRLSKELFPPHISLWLGYIPQKNELPLISQIQNSLVALKGIDVNLSEIDIKINDKEYYVCQKINKTEAIVSAHYFLLNKLNNLREGYIHPKYLAAEAQEKMDNDMKQNIKEYGTRFVGELFDPHISISFVEKDKVPDFESLKNKIPKFSGSFRCKEIVIFKQKESGKSIDILNKFLIE